MRSFLLSIVGVVFLGVLVDIIYPNGKTNAFCKSVFGFFAVIVMITPIIKLINNADFDYFIHESVVESNIIKAQEDYYRLKIEKIISDHDIDNVVVEIEGNIDNNEYIIENILIDTSNIVLSENLENINKYEVISQAIITEFGIEKERIIIYG